MVCCREDALAIGLLIAALVFAYRALLLERQDPMQNIIAGPPTHQNEQQRWAQNHRHPVQTAPGSRWQWQGHESIGPRGKDPGHYSACHALLETPQIPCQSINYSVRCCLWLWILHLLLQCGALPDEGPDLVKLPWLRPILALEPSTAHVSCKLRKSLLDPGSVSCTGLAQCCLKVLSQAQVSARIH